MHSNTMNLRILINNVKLDVLAPTILEINSELLHIYINYTYENALE